MFVCGPYRGAQKRAQKLNEVRELLQLVEEKLAVPCVPVPQCCPPCCPNALPPCPPCCPNALPPCPPPEPPMPPEVMVCYKVEKPGSTNHGRRATKQKRKKRAKSREIRAGILYRGCLCEKRNGLQDECPRTGCHGSPECLTKPEPICGPSEFCDGKHLGRKKKWPEGEYIDDEESGRTVTYNCFPATIAVNFPVAV